MGTRPTKAADNIYCRARKEAAKYNDRLNSREGAAELLGCSVSTLSDYELGITKIVPVDSVVRMADLYNAPELKNYYCAHECPIGITCVEELKIEDFDRNIIQLLSSLDEIETIKKQVLKISANGKVDEDEKSEFAEILQRLEYVSRAVQQLRMWSDKNIKREV